MSKLEKDNFPRLMLHLKRHFPFSKSMWQIVKDVKNGKMEANLFVDQWPDFNTVISQEFIPRLSEIADLRIFTRRKETVMEVINGAKLLEQAGKRLHIMYITKLEESEEVSEYLLGEISQHPCIRGKKVSLSYIPVYFGSKQMESSDLHPPPPGYVLGDLLPEHAEHVASHWQPHFSIFSYDAKYLRDIITRLGAAGVYMEDDPSKPVAWCFRKPGGINGIGYTMEGHRGKGLFLALRTEFYRRQKGKDDVALFESHDTLNKKLYEGSGRNHNITVRDNLSSKF